MHGRLASSLVVDDARDRAFDCVKEALDGSRVAVQPYVLRPRRLLRLHGEYEAVISLERPLQYAREPELAERPSVSLQVES